MELIVLFRIEFFVDLIVTVSSTRSNNLYRKYYVFFLYTCKLSKLSAAYIEPEFDWELILEDHDLIYRNNGEFESNSKPWIKFFMHPQSIHHRGSSTVYKSRIRR